MKLSEFLNMLERYKSKHEWIDQEVVIRIHNPEHFPSTPTIGIRSVYPGMDWDSGKVIIVPDKVITTYPIETEDEKIKRKMEAVHKLAEQGIMTKKEVDDIIKKIKKDIGRKI